MIQDRATGRSKGFGFVEMDTEAQAQAAIEGLHDQEHDGRRLTVNEAKPREDRGGGGGGYGGGGGGGGGRAAAVAARWRRRRLRWRWRRRPALLIVVASGSGCRREPLAKLSRLKRGDRFRPGAIFCAIPLIPTRCAPLLFPRTPTDESQALPHSDFDSAPLPGLPSGRLLTRGHSSSVRDASVRATHSQPEWNGTDPRRFSRPWDRDRQGQGRPTGSSPWRASLKPNARPARSSLIPLRVRSDATPPLRCGSPSRATYEIRPSGQSLVSRLDSGSFRVSSSFHYARAQLDPLRGHRHLHDRFGPAGCPSCRTQDRRAEIIPFSNP